MRAAGEHQNPVNRNQRIELTDNVLTSVMKLCEGNPGALRVCMETVSRGKEIDPDSFMAELTGLLSLDAEGIYGPRIWMLYKDVCGESLGATMGLLRCVQLGLLHGVELHHAIDNRGDGINLPELMKSLHKRLPNFKVPAIELEAEVSK